MLTHHKCAEKHQNEKSVCSWTGGEGGEGDRGKVYLDKEIIVSSNQKRGYLIVNTLGPSGFIRLLNVYEYSFYL